MRILHTSDWHLGRIFYGIYLTDDQAYLLDRFIELVKDAKPDAIIISGDIYDRSVPPVEAVDLFDDVVTRILIDYKVPIITIAGNHDSPDRLGFGYRIMYDRGFKISGRLNMDMLSTVIDDKYGPVNFYSIPYVEPATVREKFNDETIHTHDESMQRLVGYIKDHMNKRQRNVLIAHTYAAGCEESESERPLSVGGSGAVNPSIFEGFNYTALGHLHRPQKVGCEYIRYSGSLMKYSFAEANHKKYIYIVDMDGEGKVKVEGVELKPRHDIRCIEGYLDELKKGPQSGESRDDYIMATVKDETAILDVMGQLRSVYPNILHIERPQYVMNGNLCGPSRNFRKMNDIDLFSSFYRQVTDNEISAEQGGILKEILDRYYEDAREA